MFHLHVGALDGLVVACYVILFLFAARLLAAKTADSPFGKALAALIS